MKYDAILRDQRSEVDELRRQMAVKDSELAAERNVNLFSMIFINNSFFNIQTESFAIRRTTSTTN